MSFLKFAVRLASLLLAASLLPAAQQTIQAVSPASAGRQVQFNIYLPLENTAQLDALLAQLHDPNSPQYRQWLTPAQFRSQFGPNPADMARIAADLKSRNLTVVATHSHGLTVSGSVAAVQSLLGVPLYNGRKPDGTATLVTQQAIQLPALYTQAGAHVAAFSRRAPARPHSVRTAAAPANRYSNVGPYWFDDLKEAYDFPSYRFLTGKGRQIAVVMACDYLDSDMAAYFGHEKLAVPAVVRKPVDGGSPFDPNSGACVENALDIQQSGGMAPGATILDYNVPDLGDSSVMDAYLQIVEDNLADVVTSSFGSAEGIYTAAYNDGEDFTWILLQFEDVFKQGNAQGITFVASSGDSGALGLPSLSYFLATPQTPPVVAGAFQPGIEWPASSPRVTAVGGTNLVTSYSSTNKDSRYVRENADFDPLQPYDPYGVGNLASGGVWQGGGGPSVVFAQPPYQRWARTGFNMRTVPDISFHMGGCPEIAVQPCAADRSAVIAAFDYADLGGYIGLVGTSAGSPAVAGIVALAEENLRTRLGNVNYFIYQEAAAQPFSPAFHQGIPGDDGLFFSPWGLPGYNLVTGNGTPFVQRLILAPFVPAAGTPQTPSNP